MLLETIETLDGEQNACYCECCGEYYFTSDTHINTRICEQCDDKLFEALEQAHIDSLAEAEMKRLGIL